jgi:hypothetical protein
MFSRGASGEAGAAALALPNVYVAHRVQRCARFKKAAARLARENRAAGKIATTTTLFLHHLNGMRATRLIVGRRHGSARG